MIMNRISDAIYDFFYFKVPEKWEKLSRRKHQINATDRAQIYGILHSSLVTGKRSISDVLFDIAKANKVDGKREASEMYDTIAVRIKSHQTNTPIADAFKEFIPKDEYNSLKSAESDAGGKKNTLRQALPFIQAENTQRLKLKRLFLTGALEMFIRIWLPLIVIYPYLDFWLLFIDPFWAKDVYHPVYMRWTAVQNLSKDLIILGGFLYVSYCTFYLWFRTHELTEFRLACNRLPLFNSHSILRGASLLTALALQMRLSQETNLPTVIVKSARASEPYARSILEDLSDDTARSSFRDAIAGAQGIPKQLRSSLILTNATETDNKGIIDNVAKAVDDYVEKTIRLRNVKRNFVIGLSYVIVGAPAVDALFKTMEAM